MRIDNTIYFCDDIRVADVDFENKNQILKSFYKRINDYYLAPANILNQNRKAFATVTLLMSAIDAITFYSINNRQDRIKDFVLQSHGFLHISANLRERIAREFYLNFRHGLIHEGRVKNCGQFSYDFEEIALYEDNFLIVNPDKLLNAVEGYLRQYIITLKKEENIYNLFIGKIKRHFLQDIQRFGRE